MATKKKSEKMKASNKKLNAFDIQNLIGNSDAYKSLIYGIITVIVLFMVIFLGVRTLSQKKPQVDNGAISTKQVVPNSQKTYVVSEGETLWSIAEKEYGDGFKWEEIAKANNIGDATSLSKGAVIVIPTLKTTPTPSASPSTENSKGIVGNSNSGSNTTGGSNSLGITGNVYTVVHGDNLWNIAVRAYGDGYRWVDIAKANNLANPSLIFAGNIFKLPRP